MRLLILTLCVLFIGSTGYGQLRSYKVNEERVASIKKKLYVVTHERFKEHNDMFLSAVEKYWKFSEYEVVDEAKINETFQPNDDVSQLHIFNGDFGMLINIPAIGITEKLEKKGTYEYRGYGAGYFWPNNWKFNWLWNPSNSVHSNSKTIKRIEDQGTKVFMALAIQRLNYFWSNTEDENMNVTFVSQWKTINKSKGKLIKTKRFNHHISAYKTIILLL